MAITVPRLAYHLLENRSSRDRSEGSVTPISGIRLYNTNNKGAEKTPVTTINLAPFFETVTQHRIYRQV